MAFGIWPFGSWELTGIIDPMTRKAALVAALVVGLWQTGSAQQQQPAQQPPPQQGQPADTPQQPTFRGGINFVRVDVIVTDGKQQPVTDLTQADFELLEDGKPQAIEQFRLVRVDGNP